MDKIGGYDHARTTVVTDDVKIFDERSTRSVTYFQEVVSIHQSWKHNIMPDQSCG